MANYTGIEQALVNGYLAVDPTTPTEFPNDSLQPDIKAAGLWAKFHNVRGGSSVATLGSKGEDNHPGFLQIDLNIPENKGSGDVLAKADFLLSAFPAGTVLAYNGQKVKVQGSSLSPGRYIGGYYRVSLTINYYARTVRNA